MSTYVIHDTDGRAVSVGTKVADPLPAGLTAVQLADADADGLRFGSKQWDQASRTVIDRPVVAPPPSPKERLAAAVTALGALDTLAAPVLAADVLDVLDDLRSAFGGV